MESVKRPIVTLVILLTTIGSAASQWNTVPWNTGSELSQVAVHGDTMVVAALYDGVFQLVGALSSEPTVLFATASAKLGPDPLVGFRFRDPEIGSFRTDVVVTKESSNTRTNAFLIRLDGEEQPWQYLMGPHGDTLSAPFDPGVPSIVFFGPEGRLFVPEDFASYVWTDDWGASYTPYEGSLSDSTCSPMANVIRFKLIGTPWHLIEVAGTQILTVHSDGRRVLSEHQLLETNGCNQLEAAEAIALDSNRLVIVDRTGRWHVSADGGESWQRTPTGYEIVCVSSSYGIYIDLTNDGGPLGTLNFKTGKVDPAIVTDGVVNDTLWQVAVNGNMIVGTGATHLWRRMHPDSVWVAFDVERSLHLTADAAGSDGMLISLQLPYALAMVDLVEQERTFSQAPFQSAPIKSLTSRNGLLAVERSRALSSKYFSGVVSTLAVPDTTVVDIDRELTTTRKARITPVAIAATQSGMAVYYDGVISKRVANGQWSTVAAHIPVSQQQQVPLFVDVEDGSHVLVLESETFHASLGPDFFAEPASLDLPHRQPNKASFPAITSAAISDSTVLLSYGVYDTDPPTEVPSVVKGRFENGAVEDLTGTLSATYCLAATEYAPSAYVSIVQRRTAKQAVLSHGAVYLQRWDAKATAWDVLALQGIIGRLGAMTVATFDERAVLYVASESLDSVLIVHPPYEEPRWTPMPVLSDGEFPTAVCVHDSVLLLGTNRNLYALLLTTTDVQIVIPKESRIAFRSYPNPVSESMSVEVYNIGLQGAYRLELIDITGRLVADLSEHLRDLSGQYILASVPIIGVPSGPYLLHHSIAEVSKSQMVNIVR